jgi:fibronectin-binding autotransporter adhesin
MKKLTSTVRGATFVAALAFTQFASAQSTWTSATSGDWTNDANWTGGIPNAISAVAIFSNNWTGQLITNEAATVGQILATDTTSGGGVANAAVTITGGTLTLDNGASKAIISTGTNNAFSENSRLKIASVLDGTNGFERQGSGYLDLSGTVNLFTGTIVLNSTNSGGGSFTVINSDANLGNATNTIQVGLGATATGFYNDGSAGAFTLNANRSIVTSGTGDFWVKNKAGANMTIAGVISGTTRLRKNDSGDLTLTAANTFTGGTLIDGTGRLVLSGGNNRLLNTSFVQFATNGIFDITSTSQTLSNLVTGATFVSTVRGTNGALIVNGNLGYNVSRTTTGTSLDMSGLSSFTLSPVGGVAGRTNNFTANGANVTNTIILAAGTNTFENNSIFWGGGGANAAGQRTIVRLGQVNNIYAGTNFHIANFQGSGEVIFQTGLNNPVLTVRGSGGGANSIGSMAIGHVNSGNQGGTGILDATGGSVDILANALSLAEHNTGANTFSTGTMTMPAGTVVATTLNIAKKTATTGTPTVTGTFNQSGGTVTADTVYFGANEGTAAANFIANYNLTGGTLFAGTIGGLGATYGASTVRNLNVNGGTVRNKSGGDLAINGVANSATGRLNIVIGASGGTIEADASRNVSVGVNALISGAGTLTKAGNGTLTINSASTHTGGTTINAGSIVLGASAAISTNTLTFSGASGTLDVGANNQTVRNISLENTAGNKTITGNGGSLTVIGDVNQVFVATLNGVVYDLAGLSSFTYNRANREFGASATGAGVTNTLNFAATNTITAVNIRLGGGGTNNGTGQNTIVKLGQVNTWNADTDVLLGNFQGSGNISFANGLTDPSLFVRGITGGSSAVPLFRVANTSSGALATTGILDLTGGSLDLIATEMDIAANSTAEASSAATGTLTMPAGNIDVGTLSVARRTANGTSGNPVITGTLNQSGGAVTADTVVIGNQGASGGTPTLTANYNLTGGTLAATSITAIGTGVNAASVRNLNVSGGIVRNKSGGDLAITGLAATASGRLNVALEASGGTFEADAGRTITIGANTLLTGSGSLTKAGAGTLILSSGIASANTGALNISNGVVNLAGSGVASAGLVSSVAVATNAVLLISQSDQVNNSATVTLSGGTITRASGVSEVFGALSLDFDSVLDFGSGTSGNMRFGVYEGGATPSALLTVNNFFGGNTLTFGTDLSDYISSSYSGTAFTSDYFNINSTSGGFTSSWNGSTFTITAIPEPSTYLAAAALLGLMLWPSRRRLLKDAKSILGLRAPMRDRLARR